MTAADVANLITDLCQCAQAGLEREGRDQQNAIASVELLPGGGAWAATLFVEQDDSCGPQQELTVERDDMVQALVALRAEVIEHWGL